MRNRIASMARVVPGFLLAAALTACAAAATAAQAAGEHNLAETIERFESLRVGGSSAPVSDLRLTSGHLVLVCKTGTANLVRYAISRGLIEP